MLLHDKFSRNFRAASLLTVGNRFLADAVARTGTTAIVRIIPSVVDTSVWKPNEEVDRTNPVAERRPVIGWIGSPSTERYLSAVLDEIKAFAREAGATIRVCGARDIHDEPGLLETVGWSETGEIDFVRSLDVGLMPLDDTPWERGKCGYKAIQYMSCAKPVVVSPVGVNVEIVTDGIEGRHARHPSDWSRALIQLALDPVERARAGEAARKRVVADYSLSSTLPKVLDAFAAAVSGTAR